jgi:hypothetical protein
MLQQGANSNELVVLKYKNLKLKKKERKKRKKSIAKRGAFM